MKGLDLMEKKMIEKKAYDLLESTEMGLDEPVDVVRLARRLGFAIGNAEIKDGTDGFIMIDKNKKNLMNTDSSMVIGVNVDRSFEEKRFIAGHELGHYALHYNESEPIYAMREKAHGRGDEENEVDYFAACLLMPERGFKAYYKRFKKESGRLNEVVEKLAETFKVPADSVLRRLEELNLVGMQ